MTRPVLLLRVVILCLTISLRQRLVMADPVKALQYRLLQQEEGVVESTTALEPTNTILLEDHNATEYHDEEHHDDHVEDDEELANGFDEHDHHEEDHEEHENQEEEHHDDHGTEEDLLLENGVSTTNSKPWGEALLASFLINVVTLTGIIFLSGEFIAKHYFKRDILKSSHYLWFINNIIPSFSCGALLATTVFLMLPEALHLISAHFSSGDDGGHGHRFLEEEHEDHEEDNAEGATAWRFGACILAGFLLPVITSSIFSHNHDVLLKDPQTLMIEEASPGKMLDQGRPEQDSCSVEDGQEIASDASATAEKSQQHDSKMTFPTKSGESANGSDILVLSEDKIVPSPIDWSLTASIMIGDFFHNFADGIFVGTGFLMCSRDLAIAITVATIYHEIAQEIADYFMLTRFCNHTPGFALLLNFISGLSVMLGACLILGIKEITSVAIGCILAISAGVYMYIAMVECFPRAMEGQKTLKDKFFALLAFLVGVIPISLVLLNHGHCEAEANAH